MTDLKRSCGSCIFFDREIPHGEKKLHRDIGKKAHGKPCTAYEVNPFPAVATRNVSDLELLSSVIRGVPKGYLENLAQTIVAAGKLERSGLKFMQRVAWQWRGQAGDHYMNNFLIAHVLSINAAREVRLTTTDGSIAISTPLSGIIKLPRFKKIRENMIAAGRYRDPKYRHTDVPSRFISDAEAASVKTLESVIGTEFSKLFKVERGPGKTLAAAAREAEKPRPKNRGAGSRSFKVTGERS